MSKRSEDGAPIYQQNRSQDSLGKAPADQQRGDGAAVFENQPRNQSFFRKWLATFSDQLAKAKEVSASIEDMVAICDKGAGAKEEELNELSRQYDEKCSELLGLRKKIPLLRSPNESHQERALQQIRRQHMEQQERALQQIRRQHMEQEMELNQMYEEHKRQMKVLHDVHMLNLRSTVESVTTSTLPESTLRPVTNSRAGEGSAASSSSTVATTSTLPGSTLRLVTNSRAGEGSAASSSKGESAASNFSRSILIYSLKEAAKNQAATPNLELLKKSALQEIIAKLGDRASDFLREEILKMNLSHLSSLLQFALVIDNYCSNGSEVLENIISQGSTTGVVNHYLHAAMDLSRKAHESRLSESKKRAVTSTNNSISLPEEFHSVYKECKRKSSVFTNIVGGRILAANTLQVIIDRVERNINQFSKESLDGVIGFITKDRHLFLHNKTLVKKGDRRVLATRAEVLGVGRPLYRAVKNICEKLDLDFGRIAVGDSYHESGDSESFKIRNRMYELTNEKDLLQLRKEIEESQKELEEFLKNPEAQDYKAKVKNSKDKMQKLTDVMRSKDKEINSRLDALLKMCRGRSDKIAIGSGESAVEVVNNPVLLLATTAVAVSESAETRRLSRGGTSPSSGDQDSGLSTEVNDDEIVITKGVLPGGSESTRSKRSAADAGRQEGSFGNKRLALSVTDGQSEVIDQQRGEEHSIASTAPNAFDNRERDPHAFDSSQNNSISDSEVDVDGVIFSDSRNRVSGKESGAIPTPGSEPEIISTEKSFSAKKAGGRG